MKKNESTLINSFDDDRAVSRMLAYCNQEPEHTAAEDQAERERRKKLLNELSGCLDRIQTAKHTETEDDLAVSRMLQSVKGVRA